MIRFIDADGCALRVQGGPARAEVVLVHELAGSSDSWSALRPWLPEGTVSYDLRGAGLSEKAPGPYDMETMLRDLGAVLDATATEGPVTLVGAAVGGLIALAFAARNPGRVKRLVLLGPALGIPAERHAAVMETTARIESLGLRATAAAMLPMAFPEDLWADSGLRDHALNRWLGADPQGYAATYRMLASSSAADYIPDVCCPVDLIFATRDAFNTPEALDAGTAGLSGRRVHHIDAGHFAHVQSPQIVGPLLQRLLQN